MYILRLTAEQKVFVIGNFCIIPLNGEYKVQEHSYSRIGRFHSYHHQQVAISNGTKDFPSDEEIFSHIQSLGCNNIESKGVFEQIKKISDGVIIVCLHEKQIIGVQDYVKKYKYISDLTQLLHKTQEKKGSIIIIPQHYETQKLDIHFIAQYILCLNSQQNESNLHFLNNKPFYHTKHQTNISLEYDMLKYISQHINQKEFNIIVAPDANQTVNCFYNQQIINSEQIGSSLSIIMLGNDNYLHFLQDQGFTVNQSRIIQTLQVKQTNTYSVESVEELKYLSNNMIVKIPISTNVQISSDINQTTLYYHLGETGLQVSDNIYRLLSDENGTVQFLLKTFYNQLSSAVLGLLSEDKKSICQIFTVKKVQEKYIYMQKLPYLLDIDINPQIYEDCFQQENFHFVILRQ